METVEIGPVVGIGCLTPMVVGIADHPNFPGSMRDSAIAAPFFLLGSVITTTIMVAFG